MQCATCGSTKLKSKGLRKTASGTKLRKKCAVCGRNHTFELPSEDSDTLVRLVTQTSEIKRYVITACQNNTDVNESFLGALESYCEQNSAELMIVPILYRQDEFDEIAYHLKDRHLSSFVRTKLKLHDELFVMGSFNFIPTTTNPLSGMESISKGASLIIPSPQLRMKSLAVSASRHPAILITTGAISKPEYVSSKTGEKAKFNHSYSATLVEIDRDGDYHIRVLNAAEDGSFYDLDTHYYEGGSSPNQQIECLITGDEHAIYASPEVEAATYTGNNSIVNTLAPKIVVRHDVLDCYSVSHHHRRDSILSVGKHMFGKNSIEDELNATLDYLERTTVGDYYNVIVSSNHNDHLTKWLKEVDIKTEPWNARIYHRLMYEVLGTLEETDVGVTYANPFKLYSELKGRADSLMFLTRDTPFVISGIELNAHGDVGMNGSKGSIGQYSNLSQKYVIGHSHTPGIVYGAYQVGTSSRLKLEYTSGPSSWMNTHCIIHKNGKRQLINIISGKWRA